MEKKKQFIKKKRNNYMDKTVYTDHESGPKNEGSVDTLLNRIALKDMPKSSYSIIADPYTAALSTSVPYPILNKFLKTVGGRYRGEDNIDGGNVQQYAQSVTSTFLKYTDSLRMNIDCRYRYLPIIADVNKIGYGLIDEMRKSIAEAISQLNASTYTALKINNFAVRTDMAMGSAETEEIEGAVSGSEPLNLYTDPTDVVYAISIYYQTFLQEILTVLNAHNSFRMKQGTAIRDSWNRETPYLNSLFGLFNKKAWLNLIDSVNLSMEGEYIDTDFMRQMNMLTFVPSRRSNAMTDPTLEIVANLQHPSTFQIYLLNSDGKYYSTPVFDDADMVSTLLVDGVSTTVSFWTACQSIKEYLSLEATKRWARSEYNQTGTTVRISDNARYNTVKSYFDVITNCVVRFKPRFADYRECLDIMTRTGAVTWSKGFRPSITPDTDGEIFQNLIVDDIYKMVMSGPNTLNFNNRTKRWESYSQWNMYYGVPDYDRKQGGAFISMSSKSFAGSASGNETVPYLPIMFDPSPSSNNIYIVGIARDGAVSNIKYKIENIKSNRILARLAPLESQSDLSIRIPYLSYSNNNGQLDSDHFSLLYKTLVQVFGLCVVESTLGTFDYGLDPDILCIYQFEISDITNAATTYARANAPFRGTTSEEGLLGFFGVVG